MKKHKKYLLVMGTLLAGVGLRQQTEIAEAVVETLVGMDLDAYIAQQQAQHPNLTTQDKNVQATAASYNFIHYEEADTEATASTNLLKEATVLDESESVAASTSEGTSESKDTADSQQPPAESAPGATTQTSAPKDIAPAPNRSEKQPPAIGSTVQTTTKDSEKNQRDTSKTDNKASGVPNQDTEAVTERPVSLIDQKKSEANVQFSVQPNQTTAQFIEKIGSDAQAVAWENDLYASVMIAQAILETGSGNSQLAREPNYNLFGIKGDFKGKKVTFSTQEDRGDGTMFIISSDFRKYPGYRESLADYAALLRNGIAGNRTFYAPVWKSNAANYQAATKWLTGRYATDTHYDKKLNALIKAYQLTKFDSQPYTTTKNNQKQTKQPVTKKRNSENAPKNTPNRAQLTVITGQPPTKTGNYLFKLPVAAETTVNQLLGAVEFYANAVLGNSYGEYEEQFNE